MFLANETLPNSINSFVKVVYKFCQKLNKPWKFPKYFFKFCQSGEILPNLVTQSGIRFQVGYLPSLGMWQLRFEPWVIQLLSLEMGRLGLRTHAHFVRGSITVQLTYCLTGLDSDALLMFNQQQIYLWWPNPNSQTGGQLYSDTSSYKIIECSLIR